MNTEIRFIEERDKPLLLAMMQDFYSSPAVYTNGSEEIFSRDIDACLERNPYIEGYVFELSGEIQSYAMLAKSFSTEFGKRCIWIEDLYIKEEFRGLGIGKSFLDFIFQKYDGAIFRLEVEEENENALRLYKKCGFDALPYMEMKKE